MCVYICVYICIYICIYIAKVFSTLYFFAFLKKNQVNLREINTHSINNHLSKVKRIIRNN